MELCNKIPHKEFINVIQHAPLISCDILLIKEDNILLGIRNNEPAKGYLFNPGGRIYKDEPLIECILRILQTELHYTPLKPFQCIYKGTYHHPYDTNFAEIPNISTEYYSFGYMIDANDWKMTFEGKDNQHEQFMWVPIQSVLEERYQKWHIHPNVTKFFEVHTNNKIGSITIVPNKNKSDT